MAWLKKYSTIQQRIGEERINGLKIVLEKSQAENRR